jgi:hypothetical protein
MGRSIGLDVHRDFCQVAIADGGRARSAGRIATAPEQLELFAHSLGTFHWTDPEADDDYEQDAQQDDEIRADSSAEGIGCAADWCWVWSIKS